MIGDPARAPGDPPRLPRALVRVLGGAALRRAAPGGRLNPVFLQLIRNLAGGAAPELRIGGVTTDNTWWPVPGMRAPAGVTFSLDPPMDRDHRRGGGEARGAGDPGDQPRGRQPGSRQRRPRHSSPGWGASGSRRSSSATNPSSTAVFTWGFSGAPGRPSDWDFAQFEPDFARIGGALPRLPAGRTDRRPAELVRLPAAVPVRAAPRGRGDPASLPAPAVLPRPEPDQVPVDRPSAGAGRLARAGEQRGGGRRGRRCAPRGAAHRRDEHGLVRRRAARWPSRSPRRCGRSTSCSRWPGSGSDGVNIHTFPGATYQLFTFTRRTRTVASRGRARLLRPRRCSPRRRPPAHGC